MTITAAAVLYVVIWFMTLFVTLPIRAKSQAESGEVVPGTHAGAPADFRVRRTVIIVTLIATVLFAITVTIILSGWIGVEDMDFLGTMGN